MTAKLTHPEFIRRSIERHGDAYDYGQAVYTHQYAPVFIVCREHGLFSQTPKAHMKGRGCQECGRAKAGRQAMATEEFVARSIAIHGDKYDYSRAVYRNGEEAVSLFCRQHGVWFDQQPFRHLSGATSCTKCYRAAMAKARTKTTQRFIRDATAVHGDRFDYSKTVYIGAQAKLTVTCREHGDFEQLATNHLAGYGCAECAVQQVFHELHIPTEERDDPAFLYVVLIDVDGQQFVKLGYSTDCKQRFYKLSHERVTVLESQVFELTKFAGFRLERETHQRFAASKVKPPRSFGGSTECYPVDMRAQLVDAIVQNMRIANGEVRKS